MFLFISRRREREKGKAEAESLSSPRHWPPRQGIDLSSGDLVINFKRNIIGRS